MKRNEWNIKIYYLLKFNKNFNNLLIKYDKMNYFFDKLWENIHTYPDWRFGQIILNKFAPLYEQGLEGEFECEMINLLFENCETDPFYENSFRTYYRLNERV